MHRQAMTGEHEVGLLLRALQTIDPSWKLSSIADDVWSFDNQRKTWSNSRRTWALSQGTHTFCRGYDLPKLLQDFVEASHDRGYIDMNGFRLPGALKSVVDVDDLVTRLKLLF